MNTRDLNNFSILNNTICQNIIYENHFNYNMCDNYETELNKFYQHS